MNDIISRWFKKCTCGHKALDHVAGQHHCYDCHCEKFEAKDSE